MYANEFSEIPAALAQNQQITRRMVALVASEGIVGKATEEPQRLTVFREILRRLTLGQINIHQAIRQVELDLPRSGSVHHQNNRVFPRGWAERIVRTQYSRFYNQAVLDALSDAGEKECYVPPSQSQQATSKCSRDMAGRVHRVSELRSNLMASYGRGDWSRQKKTIPEHPHCTHVVRPVVEA